MPFFTGSFVSVEAARFLPWLPVLALVSLLLLWALRRSWLSRLDPPPRPLAAPPHRKALEGALWALVLAAACIAVPAAAGGFRGGVPGWRAFPYPGGPPGWRGAGRVALLFLVQSLSEELLFRGVVLGALGALLLFLLWRIVAHPLPGEPEDSPRLGQARHRAWLLAGFTGNAVQAGLFAVVHGANPWMTPLASVNIGLAGFVLGWLYWSQGSLWGAWAYHFVWNFSLAAAGVPVSGVTATPPLLPLGLAGARGGLLSGGPFGPEGSLVTTAALLGLVAVLAARTGPKTTAARHNP